ncbi:unnamed protein product [Effrenium voratum]|uniref:cGMP-dependent protein kinase n=1 Tax=Effrenium voratum TaxID=2562239 RepID=A0AA36HMD5_9DINO|nr:unnamed protein product [Effrenium voratum]
MGCAASIGRPEEITIGVITQKRKARSPLSSKFPSNLQGKQGEKADSVNREYQEKIEFLLTVPLFQRLPQDEHPVVASVCEICRFKRMDPIIRQGARGEEFFVIKSGQADVYAAKTEGKQEKIASLKAGDHFGEGALLRDEPRTATIVAMSEVQALKIKRSDFQSLGLHKKLKFGRRAAVSSNKQSFDKAKEPTPKTDVDKQLIAQAMRTNENLWVIGNLEDKIPAMTAVMWKEYVKAGKRLITEGDMEADFFYVVQEGKFEITVREEKLQGLGILKGPQNYLVVGQSRKGQSFGEVALLYCSPRAATVRALTNSVVWVLDRAHFKDILLKASEAKIQEYRGYLDNVPLLSALLKEERNELARALVEMHFSEGEKIITQHETGNTFYILFAGSVDVYKDEMQVTSLEASVSRKTAQYFGEYALIENEKRTATIQVRSPTARCLVLDRDSFQKLLGPLKEIIESHKAIGKDRWAQERTSGPEAALAADREKIFKQDLSYVGLLGVGGFSKVELWQHMVSGTSYALKVMDRGHIQKHGMEDTVKSEKKAMLMTRSPWVVRLVECYTSVNTLEILMEACLGGELLATYSRKGLWGSLEHTRYYVAGAVMALEHMHERRMVYRDLKPENIVLNSGGHMKLTDLGLAKLVIGKTYTTCGTPEYFAPEVIALSGQTLAVDWWTLGVFIYELMCSSTPFIASHPMQIYAKVMRGIDKNHFPGSCQGAPEHLVKALLRPHPGERLPMKNGVKSVKEHDFFESLDWNAMRADAVAPPYIPEVADERDVSNFFADPKDVASPLAFREDDTGWDDFPTVD